MKKQFLFSIALTLLVTLSTFAQVSVDHPIVLTGTGTNAKISGIQSVSANQDAASVDYIQRDSLQFAVASGSGNAYVVNLSPAVTSMYTVGMIVHFIANFANTGAATLAVNSLPAETIMKNYNNNLVANDIQNGQAVSVMYDGTNFQMLSQLGNVAAVFLPTVLSTVAAVVTANTATSGGVVSSNGGAAVTAYGVCWGASPNPVLGVGNYTTDGAGTGAFTSNITGLGYGTTYIRAYATNSVGTAYGPQTIAIVPVTIGQAYEGGIVAYILQPGDNGYDPNLQHGLIAATSNQSTSITWWNGTDITTGATGTAIGTGMSNTTLIDSLQGVGSYAASICTAYTDGGYTDWYLPSVDELNELYINQDAIGGFSSVAVYWCSTEYAIGNAWVEYFNGTNSGLQGNDPKDAIEHGVYVAHGVRAVRSF